LGLHFYEDVKWVVVGILALLAVLIPTWQTARARRAEEIDQARALDAALAGGAMLTVEQRCDADLGVRRKGATRSEHVESVKTAMLQSWLVIVTGPQGVGKTQAALEALRSLCPGVVVICPVDADGLAILLTQQEQLVRAIADRSRRDNRSLTATTKWPYRRWQRLRRIEPPVPLVLWLDDFERFVDQIEVDLIGRLASATGGPEFNCEPAVADGPRVPVKVRVVATIRDDDCKRILDANDDAAHRARRLLARGLTVTLEPQDASGSTGQAIPPAASAPDGLDSLEPPKVDDLRPTAPAMGSLVLLGSVLLALLGLFGLLWLNHHDLQVPPSLATQAATIESGLPACATSTPPSSGHLKEDAIWVLPVVQGSCPASDYVSVYTVDAGRLNWAFAEKPKSPTTWWFRCAGPSGECTLPAGGSETMIVGGFTHTGQHTAETVPLVLYRYNYNRGDADHIRVLAPNLPAPTGDFLPKDELPLLPGAPSNGIPDGSCPHPAELCGQSATYIAAAPVENGAAGVAEVLLIAGYAVGPWYDPGLVATEAFALQYRNHGNRLADVVFNSRPCSASLGGSQEKVVTLYVPPEDSINAIDNLMRSRWLQSQPRC
jgi:hypothetical protein